MVKFPGLGLTFDINRIAFSVFGVDIYWYAICIVIGMVLGIFVAYKNPNKFGLNFEFVFENFVYGIIFGIMGARLYYVVFNLEYYMAEPIRIFRIRDGGLAIYGGLIFGALAMFFRCKACKINFWNLLDFIAPSVAIAQSVGRWGNFFNIEAYGTECTNIFRMGISTPNGYMEVHPVFLYESILTMTIFVILIILQKKRKFEGQIVGLYLFLYSGGRAILEGVRTDSLMLENFRISQILSVAIFVVSGIMLLKNYIKYIYKKIDGLN